MPPTFWQSVLAPGVKQIQTGRGCSLPSTRAGIGPASLAADRGRRTTLPLNSRSLPAAKMTPTPHPKGFQGRPRAPNKALDENMAQTGVGVKTQAPIGAIILTPTSVRAISR